MKVHFKFLATLGLILFSNGSYSSGKYIGLNQDQVSALGGNELGSGMWGDSLALDIRIFDGKTNIFLIEFYGEYVQQPNGSKRRSSRTTDFLAVDVSKDERISDGGSFRCLDGEKSVIGAFKKSAAKEHGRFSASRAWKIDEISKKILPLASVKSVTCDWSRNGDEEFPKNL